MKLSLGIIIWTLVLSVSGQSLPGLRMVAEWAAMDFDFPSDTVRQEALDSGDYVQGLGLPIDVDVDYHSQHKTRIFVTFPRSRPGIPVTLGTISSFQAGRQPLISAYPNYWWQSSQGRNCSGITNVYRIAVSECVCKCLPSHECNLDLISIRLMNVLVSGSAILAV